MRFSLAVSLLFALPAAIAAAVAPRSPSLAQAAQEHEIVKRGATCYNEAHTGGYKDVPREDIQGLVDQLYSVGSNTVLLVSQVAWSGSSTFTYSWGQAKLCLENNYYTPYNTHVGMGEAAWVVSFILNSCSAG
jgi:hypothetical protein